jgi:hypothetical protein
MSFGQCDDERFVEQPFDAKASVADGKPISAASSKPRGDPTPNSVNAGAF